MACKEPRRFSALPTTLAAALLTKDFGIRLPILFHPRSCDTSGDAVDCDKVKTDSILFTGELYKSVEGGQAMVNGDLKMQGTWEMAFGMPFLHLSNITLGIGLNMAVGIFPPTRVEMGGSACIGTASSCESGSGHFIKCRAYVGVSSSNPADNYFVGMVSTLTLGKVFLVLGDTMAPKFKEWYELIPGPLRDVSLGPLRGTMHSYPSRLVVIKLCPMVP